MLAEQRPIPLDVPAEEERLDDLGALRILRDQPLPGRGVDDERLVQAGHMPW